ncbi:class I SAM-dependent methyltransferase [Teredinibacter sp. KSP-S5-2]|uniref:class I SAM-dependent methyltransferase n=1 Tax=Teredinibacter sp. KSP-S5-2 TaxID=3034506 RepID=UPI002934B889|nr:class I SAM-dependent methyltransferase [Teredinibacter sp. KSP-S5-2]WNO10802.1 class I SAM-dependent methyltransferase [Teredinibacter sp. KSP-S5-2]
MPSSKEKQILNSWAKNASPWVNAIQEKQIQSRNLVTDQAIIDTVMSYSPNNVLDIGCGEGWLARALFARGVSVTGVDATEKLISQARQFGGGEFQILPYDQISSSAIPGRYDLAVCNFSLLGKDSVEYLFKTLPELLQPQGRFIVQTLHPHASYGQARYEDGWRSGSWDGFSQEFVDPAPWYFRTLESWVNLFLNNGFTLGELKETINPQTGALASLILVGGVNP